MQFDQPRLTFAHYFVLLLIIYVAFYYCLGAYPLANNNEGLYAEVAREMLVRHDYIIPHLNFVPYIEKPPLLYWLIAASYHVLGVTAFAARFVTATSGALTCIGLAWFGQQVGRAQQGWLAALIFATSVGVIIIARVVFFDMLLTCCLTWALSCFYVWWQRNQARYLFAAYTALAAAVLCKGVLALVLVGAISFSFLLVNRQGLRCLALLKPHYLLWFLLLVVPWHVAASLQQPGFAWDYFINEQVLRFLNERVPHDYYQGPIYYYLPRIFIYLLPWSLLFPLFLKRDSSSTSESAQFSWFLWLWLGMPLLFFSMSQAKANYYMIVGMPALALLLAGKIQLLLPASVTHPRKAFNFLLVSMSSLSLILLSVAPSLLQRHLADYSEFGLAQYIKTHHPQRPVFLYKNYAKQSSLLFYLQKRLSLIDANDADLAYGSQCAAANGWFLTTTQFVQSARQQKIYVAVNKANLTEFEQTVRMPIFRIVAQSKQNLILSND